MNELEIKEMEEAAKDLVGILQAAKEGARIRSYALLEALMILNRTRRRCLGVAIDPNEAGEWKKIIDLVDKNEREKERKRRYDDEQAKKKKLGQQAPDDYEAWTEAKKDLYGWPD